MSRSILLVEIGAADLPAVTPIDVVPAPWVPHVYVAPLAPPPGNVGVQPAADSVTLSWDAVEGADEYIIDVAPSAGGPWKEVARVRGTRYTYTTTSTAPIYFSVRAIINGKPGQPSSESGTPIRTPTQQELVELQMRQDAEEHARLLGDLQALADAAADATAKADAALQAAMAHANGLMAQFGDILDADTWVEDRTYPDGDFVKHGGALYRSRVEENLGNDPATSTTQWLKVGQFSSVGEAVAASVAMGTQNASDLTAESTRLDGVLARLPAGDIASKASVIAEQQARADDVAALARRIDTANAAIEGKASSSVVSQLTGRVDTIDDSVQAHGQALTSVETELAGKATNSAMLALDSRTGELESGASAMLLVQSGHQQALQQLRTDVDEQGLEFTSALTQVKSSIGGSGNILNNAGFGGMRGWTVTVNQYGASGVAEPNNGNINDGGGLYLPPQTMGMSMRAVGTFPAGTVLRVASDRIAVDKIDRVIGSVYVNSFRCIVRAFVYWFDKNNNYLGESPTLEVNQPSMVGPTLSQLPRLSAVMPSNVANVATARIAFEMVATGTQSNPYAWFVMPMLEKVAEGKSTPSSWVDGAGGLATATFAMKAAQDAQITIATDVNGKVAGIRSINDGVRSYFGILSDVFELIATGSVGMEIRRRDPGWFMRFYAAGIQLILGIKFGQANNLCGWYGPNVGEENATKANGTIWADDVGSAYFGGSLSAGTKKNAVQTTTTVTVGTELVNGPFDTNGTVRQVTVSLARQTNYVSSAFGSAGFAPGSGSNSAVVQLYRKVGAAVEALWQTLNVSGGVDVFNEFDGPDRATAYWSGSLTVNDTSPAADKVTYRALITSFTQQGVTHPGTINSITTTQNLSIISVEN